MVEYTGDHRQCDCKQAKLMKATQDISWNPKCMFCGEDLTNAPKAD